ncbi:MAG: hypothetical protein LH478_10620 [Chitinophagaceae bacterium]|nr:hypothetical protein [Chitinophagaceae bacterium]
MRKKLVLDTCMFLTYASYNKLYRLIYDIEKYDLEIFLNEELIDELERNIPGVIKVEGVTTGDILVQVSLITIMVHTVPVFNKSPDPKYNFLFDRALQTKSEVIVTKEKVLLGFSGSPVTIKDISWFKQTFEVPL